jgi:5-methylcytosine-specific restriction endonuclease McrA
METTKKKHPAASGGGWIKPKKRLAIYMRDGLACAYCGDSVENGAKLSLDHVVCHSHGGTNSEKNLVTCCSKCNSSRGNRDIKEFAEKVAAYLNHGTTGADIINHINNCLNRKLDVKAAEAVIANRRNVVK